MHNVTDLTYAGLRGTNKQRGLQVVKVCLGAALVFSTPAVSVGFDALLPSQPFYKSVAWADDSSSASAEGATTYSQSDVDNLKSQSQALLDQVNALQTELNSATEEAQAARAAYDEASEQAQAAEEALSAANEKIKELQKKLSQSAINLYKSGGQQTFLGVLLGADSFHDFTNKWDSLSRIANLNADLVDESKALKEEAAAASAELEQARDTAEQQLQLAESKQLEIAAKQASIAEQAAQMTQELANAQAEIELQAEQARAAAEAAKEALKEFTANMTAGDSFDSGSGYFANPCPGATTSSGWGWRDYDNSFHKGTDMAAAMGSPIYAAEAGTVIYATNDGGYNGGAGNWVVIAHGNGLVTKYMHCSAVYVSAGDTVERGQNIAAVGSTGDSSGPHLHFQVEVDGTAVCPYDFL
jgi:murein DD-endopeptidase MepM/ murein hydrolase activator NlpD